MLTFLRRSKIPHLARHAGVWSNSNHHHLRISLAHQNNFNKTEFLNAAKEDEPEKIEDNLNKKFPPIAAINEAFLIAAEKGHPFVIAPILESHKNVLSHRIYNTAFIAAIRANQLPTALFLFQEAAKKITLDSINTAIRIIEERLPNNPSSYSSQHTEFAKKIIDQLKTKKAELIETSCSFTPAFSKERQQPMVTSSSEKVISTPKPMKKSFNR